MTSELTPHHSTSEQRRRIVFVGSFPSEDSAGVYGGQRSVCDAIATSSLWERYEFLPLDSTQRSVPPPRLIARGAFASIRFCRLIRLLGVSDVTDVIVMVGDRASALDKGAMIVLARLCGKRTAFYPVAHSLFVDVRRHPFWARWISLVVRLSSVVICQGPATVEEVVRLGAKPASCHLVPNPIYLASWYGDTREAERTNEIVFVGWIIEQKGLFDLLHAVGQSYLLRSQPFLICGFGADSIRAQQVVEDLELSNVQLLGWIPTTQLQSILKRASLFVLPSHSEGMPQGVVEALAAGAIVVTTPVGAIPDYIIDDETGVLTPVMRPDLLAAALESLIQDAPRRERLRQAGQNLARTLFDADEACRRLGDAIEMMAAD